MRKYLLPQEGNFYKANLHCHSNFSDGRFSPEELKKMYMEKGYSIIAFTDHNILLSHSYLDDDSFLALHGFEMDLGEDKEEWLNSKECHICFIALQKDNLTVPCYHRTKYLNPKNAAKHRDKLVIDETLPDFEREYTPECISRAMETGREKGFFVTYNHPGWSLADKEDYCSYHGMHAMEICNFGSMVFGFCEYNEKEYDEMLCAQKRIFCIGADDNHNSRPEGTRLFDSFGAFTVIKAEKLEYESVTDALVKGNFYASQGPEIYSLYFEDGKIFVECSGADKIQMNTDRRHAEVMYSEDGEPIKNAQFTVMQGDKYVRITVTDKNGKKANTNAYFTDELFK